MQSSKNLQKKTHVTTTQTIKSIEPFQVQEDTTKYSHKHDCTNPPYDHNYRNSNKTDDHVVTPQPISYKKNFEVHKIKIISETLQQQKKLRPVTRKSNLANNNNLSRADFTKNHYTFFSEQTLRCPANRTLLRCPEDTLRHMSRTLCPFVFSEITTLHRHARVSRTFFKRIEPIFCSLADISRGFWLSEFLTKVTQLF